MKITQNKLGLKNQFEFVSPPKSKAEYCLEYFAAQNKLVKKTNFAARQLTNN